ncbi:hypothetical protein RCL1_004760 [Eukaryota sp. TZLM3-RCL]
MTIAPPFLQDLSLSIILQNHLALFEDIVSIPEDALKERLFDSLSLNLPLHLAVRIDSDNYWNNRLCTSVFYSRLGPTANSGPKEVYLQKYLEFVIENFVPHDSVPLPSIFNKDLIVYTDQQLNEVLDSVGEFVTKLAPSQIHPHIDFQHVLSKLPNLGLVSLSLSTYHVRSDFLLDVDSFVLLDVNEKESHFSSFCRKLMDGLKNCNEILELSLSGGLVCKNFEVILQAMESIPTLKILKLCHNKIGRKIKNFDFSNFSRLESLDLSGNFFNDLHISDLANVVKQSNSIQSINLRLNNIGDFGFEALVSALLETSTVKYLNVASNRLTSQSFVHLISLLQNGKLTHLDISNNQFVDCDSELLLIALSHRNSCLQSFIVANTGFEELVGKSDKVLL